MAFRVEISPQAFNDLDEIAEYIKERSSFEQAQKWFNGIIAAIRSLDHSPHRCHVAEESQELGEEVRVLLHGKRNRRYKVYYSVQQTTPSTGTARILHVRHWARRRLDRDQLRKLMRDLRLRDSSVEEEY